MKRIVIHATLFITAIITFYLIIDFTGPERVELKQDVFFGMPCFTARNLIVQEYDSKGNLFATRGMTLYRLNTGEKAFTRVCRIPTGFKIYWLNNFSLFRKLTHRPEFTEVTVSNNGSVCAMAAGYVWHLSSQNKKFTKSFRLDHFGLKEGRGVMSDGLLKVSDTEIYFGEYFRNPGKEKVRILRSSNFGLNWDVAYTFQSNAIRHIHALKKDPYTNNLWVCTGDEDHESIIGFSTDTFKTIIPIIHNSQTARSVLLVFTDSTVIWGTDTGSEIAGIFRYNKMNQQISKLMKINGAMFYGTRLQNGTVIMSTEVEGAKNEKDKLARLYIINENDEPTIISCGEWNHKVPARLRFQRNQGSPHLAITCMGQKQFNAETLVIIEENKLDSLINK